MRVHLRHYFDCVESQLTIRVPPLIGGGPEEDSLSFASGTE